MERLLVVDGLNQFIRNWTIVPMMNSNGEPVGGVIGFLRSLKVIMREVKPTLVVVAWDGQGGSLKRRSMNSGYKEGRKPRLNRSYDFETPEQSSANMKVQYAKLRTLLDYLGVIQVEAVNVEADDVIALIAKHICPDTQKVIVSSDRDFWQLLDKTTIIYSPTKKKYYSKNDLKEELHVLAENYIYLKAMIGDGSDNIKGLKGIGEKTVVKLFPFLEERVTTLGEIFKFAEENQEKSPKYRSILDNRDVLIANVEVMQLSSPIISAQAARIVREAVRNPDRKFVFSEFKLTLLRDGIQLTDADFLPIFQEYQMRVKKEEETNV